MRVKLLFLILYLATTLVCFLSSEPSFLFADEFKVKFIYRSEGVRDPFSLSDAVVVGKTVEKNFLSEKNIKLEGILWDETAPYAIINDEILRVGDELDGVTILKIEKERVTFGYKDELKVVPLTTEEKGE